MAQRNPAIESLMGERGRLRSAHEMLESALNDDQRDDSYVPFYIAVANFMEASMGRLEEQDILMLNRMTEILGNPDPEQTDIIAEVNRRLDGNRIHLQRFIACRDELLEDATSNSASENFAAASKAYIDYIRTNMGHHAPSTSLARKLFAESDWVDMADIDQLYFEKERLLYTELLDKRPACIPLSMADDSQAEQYRLNKK